MHEPIGFLKKCLNHCVQIDSPLFVVSQIPCCYGSAVFVAVSTHQLVSPAVEEEEESGGGEQAAAVADLQQPHQVSWITCFFNIFSFMVVGIDKL
jgi:hypothetical protein